MMKSSKVLYVFGLGFFYLFLLMSVSALVNIILLDMAILYSDFSPIKIYYSRLLIDFSFFVVLSYFITKFIAKKKDDEFDFRILFWVIIGVIVVLQVVQFGMPSLSLAYKTEEFYELENAYYDSILENDLYLKNAIASTVILFIKYSLFVSIVVYYSKSKAE